MQDMRQIVRCRLHWILDVDIRQYFDTIDHRWLRRADAGAGVMPACARPGTYVPRQTHDCDAAVLVRRHIPGFLTRLEESGQGPLPEFMKAELEGFGGCGDYAEPGIMRTPGPIWPWTYTWTSSEPELLLIITTPSAEGRQHA